MPLQQAKHGEAENAQDGGQKARTSQETTHDGEGEKAEDWRRRL